MFLELNSDALLKVFDSSLFRYIIEKETFTGTLKKKTTTLIQELLRFFINILKFKFLF